MASHPASIKSGPFLKGVMAIPRLRQDAINPREIIVFPEPPRRAAIKIRGKAMSVVSYFEITGYIQCFTIAERLINPRLPRGPACPPP